MKNLLIWLAFGSNNCLVILPVKKDNNQVFGNRLLILFQHCSVLVLANSKESENWRGSRMAPSASADGLTLTNENKVYSFECETSIPCKWQKMDYETKIFRKSHLMFIVPSELVQECKGQFPGWYFFLFFVRFLGELRIPKIACQIYWHLNRINLQ